ncbi:fibrobacter succinogenes major paralogous domain-containing protein [Fibrobacter sp. UWB12]|uniref:fibrobacter succinogenes major paralogous domain-containing protein n=1 Tax=Fibrobacter sp. UWB12 TaxID=1896203 RepID=UPI000912AC3A|nr:fibrobacter succinogenes major paralogous domain-containing protein [Fibrobacter sp. UWB12]SHK24920.1 major paralogous domain-containing protein [Fibrobacter sp. UWB12]
MNNIYALVLSIAMFFFAACSENDSSVNPSDEMSSSLTSSSNKQEKSSSSSAKSSSSVKPLSNESSKKVDDGCVYDAETNTLKDLRDGQTYKTVKIGNQVWTAENLNYKTVNSYCYNNNDKYCSKYGRLYTWSTAIDSAGVFSENGKGCGYDKECSPTYPVRGICFNGWHIPDASEWNSLFAMASDSIGAKLKSAWGWNRGSENGSDLFGFSALPAGYRDFLGSFYGDSTEAFFWSATEHDWYKARYVGLQKHNGGGAQWGFEKDYAFSVRCIKD